MHIFAILVKKSSDDLTHHSIIWLGKDYPPLKHDKPQEPCELGAIVVGAVPAIFCVGTEPILCLGKYPMHKWNEHEHRLPPNKYPLSRELKEIILMYRIMYIYLQKVRIMISVTATSFRSNIKHYMDLVIKDSQEVIINRGNEAAVLIPMDQYNAMKETEYLMASKEMEQAILTGMEDVKKGNFVEVNIDEL